jgi:hypothetical protein
LARRICLQQAAKIQNVGHAFGAKLDAREALQGWLSYNAFSSASLASVYHCCRK